MGRTSFGVGGASSTFTVCGCWHATVVPFRSVAVQPMVHAPTVLGVPVTQTVSPLI